MKLHNFRRGVGLVWRCRPLVHKVQGSGVSPINHLFSWNVNDNRVLRFQRLERWSFLAASHPARIELYQRPDRNIHFYRVPTNPKKRQLWLRAINQSNCNPCPNTGSDHFVVGKSYLIFKELWQLTFWDTSSSSVNGHYVPLVRWGNYLSILPVISIHS